MSALRLTYFLCLSALAILLFPICSAQQQNIGIETQVELDEVALNGRAINIASKKMEAVFVGRLNDSNNKIEGTWRQGGREFPLVLVRATGAPERLRPQTPRPPCSYQVEEVGDPRQTGKLNLAGTLTIPKAEGLAANQKYAKRKVAGIVLVSDNESWIGLAMRRPQRMCLRSKTLRYHSLRMETFDGYLRSYVGRDVGLLQEFW